MHVAIACDSKPLLLLTTALLPNRTTESLFTFSVSGGSNKGNGVCALLRLSQIL